MTTSSHQRVEQLQLPTLSNSAFKHYLMASSYFLQFFGTNSEISAANEAKKGKPAWGNFANLSLNGGTTSTQTQSTDANGQSAASTSKDGGNENAKVAVAEGVEMLQMPQTRTLLEYLPFINPLIRGFHPNLIVNEGTNFALPPNEAPHAYKTVMCEAWLLTAQCSYGNSCRFAHGLRELREPQMCIRDASKLQTKACLKYTTNGICPHGLSCLFYHPLPENPKPILDSVAAAESGIATAPPPFATPAPFETFSNECYMMSRSFYIDNQCFFNPYNNVNYVPQGPAISHNPDSADVNDDGQPKLLDLVFDENGNIVQHIVTSQPSSEASK